MTRIAISSGKRGLFCALFVAAVAGICGFARWPARAPATRALLGSPVRSEASQRSRANSPRIAVERAPSTAPQPSARSDIAVVLVMQEGGARVTGTVADALGGPIAGAWLDARSLRDGARVLGVSDAGGRFQLDVAPGEHEIVARAAGYSEQQLPALAPSEGLAFVLAAGSSIVGRVVEQDSRTPVADLGVSVWSVADGLGIAARSARTRADGTFVFDDLAPGAYSLQAISERFRSDERRVPLGLSEVSEPIELVVRQATQVAGSVLIEGVPCTRGWVELKGAIETQMPVDAQGHFAFDGVPKGHYEVTPSCEGALSQTEPLEVGSDRLTRVWKLSRGLQVTGAVSTPAGKPAPGVLVEVYPIGEAADRAGTRCTTDDRGEFACSGLAAGAYECTVAPGVPARSDSIRVALRVGSSARIELQMYAEAAIHARLASADGFDPRALVLLAKRPDGATTVAERRGDVFVFAPLALGSYEVTRESGPADEVQHVQLTREGQIAELSLSFAAPHTLSGRVIDDLGVGVPDAWVRASGVSAYARSGVPVLTDARGDFAVKGLAPGKYRLEASSGHGQGELEEIASDSRGALVRLLSFVAPAASDSRSGNTGAGL